MGETLSRISGGKIKATRHRVWDIGRERFSCPFFLSPKYTAIISPDILDSNRKFCEDHKFDSDHGCPNDSEEYGRRLIKKLVNAYGEFKGFKISRK